jgi:hypothetical protein
MIPFIEHPTFQLHVLIGLLCVLFLHSFSHPSALASDSFSQSDLEFFERKIRPLLAESCYECHSHRSTKLKAGLLLDSPKGIRAGGESGDIIDLEDPSQSLLLEAVRYQNPDLQMPPKTRLSAQKVQDLETWVSKGLPWPQEPEPQKDKVEETPFDLDGRRAAHWVWEPPIRQSVPKVSDNPWVRESIDAFLLRRMEENGVLPALPADRRTLLRRTRFILTGLPPSPSEVDAFLADGKPGAFERVVDRMLGSVEFGERWGRHWLDLVRYAESMGHEFDYTIPSAWRYRDYVIRAYNQDVPFDQFALEHIAGDLLKQPRMRPDTGTNESIIGTGFYWLGQQVHSPVDIRMNQLDVLDNQIDVLSKAFQGLTVTCARCHDHKFDAISTRDFYSVFGVLKSSRYQQTSLLPRDRLVNALGDLEDLQAKAHAVIERSGLLPVSSNSSVSSIKNDQTIQVLGDASGDGFKEWFFDDEALMHDPMVRPGNLVHRSGENRTVLAARTAIDSAKWSVHLQGSLRSPTFAIPHRYLHVLSAGKKSRVNVVVDNFNLIRAPIYGGLKKNLDSDTSKWMTFDLDMWQGHQAYVEIKDTLHSDLSGGGVHGPDAWFSVETVVASSDTKPPAMARSTWQLDRESIPKPLHDILDAYHARAAVIDVAPVALSMTEGDGVDTSIFIRGDPKRHGEPVVRRFLQALGAKDDIPEGSGRLALAKRVASSDNPLTARVYVNRVWHHVFGRGIVPSVDDFGVLGQAPSHPELLDWLAVWFMQDAQWSTKRLIRTLVLSSAFRMDSKAQSPEMDDRDAGNVWMHKSRLRRLEGESIRDTILKVSGQLDVRSYGPSEKIHLTSFMTGRGRPSKSGPLDGGRRRSIYVEVRRNFLSPFLTTFDTPIPYTTFGRRSQSNVPAQSLILMNDPFVLQQAASWADLIMTYEGSVASKLTLMYETALGRLPLMVEIERGAAFIAGQQMAYRSHESSEEVAKKRAWADLCHVLFNVKEFIYLH